MRAMGARWAPRVHIVGAQWPLAGQCVIGPGYVMASGQRVANKWPASGRFLVLPFSGKVLLAGMCILTILWPAGGPQ